MDLVNQQYWNDSYANMDYHIAHDAITDWLDQNVLHKNYTRLQTVFELGCFPGRYLAHLGKKGMKISGMDLTPSIEEDRFIAWLAANEIKTGSLRMGDVLKYAATSSDRYDMVCSFGFIEHFKTFGEIVALHDRLVRPDGLIVITTPNFRGLVQKSLHGFIDAENLKRHYLPSMYPEKWAKILQQLGYKLHFSGYFGGFDFWHDNPSLSAVQKTSVKFVNKLKPLLNLLPSSAVQSPFCGLIAQKSLS